MCLDILLVGLPDDMSLQLFYLGLVFLSMLGLPQLPLLRQPGSSHSQGNEGDDDQDLHSVLFQGKIDPDKSEQLYDILRAVLSFIFFSIRIVHVLESLLHTLCHTHMSASITIWVLHDNRKTDSLLQALSITAFHCFQHGTSTNVLM